MLSLHSSEGDVDRRHLGSARPAASQWVRRLAVGYLWSAGSPPSIVHGVRGSGSGELLVEHVEPGVEADHLAGDRAEAAVGEQRDRGADVLGLENSAVN